MLKHSFSNILLSFIFVVLTVFILVFSVKFVSVEVHGYSMLPSFQDGDFLFCYRSQDVKRGDIVAVKSEQLNKIVLKRVIGVSGDKVVLEDSTLRVNDIKIAEPYIKDTLYKGEFDVTVPESCIFVMGDNRNHSTDSRDVGCLEVDGIVGVCVLNMTKRLGVRRNTMVLLIALSYIVLFIMYFVRGSKNVKRSTTGCKGFVCEREDCKREEESSYSSEEE